MGGEKNEVLWRGVRPVNGISGVWPARNATRVNEWKVKEGDGLDILYTVAAGKKLFVASAWFATRLSADADARCSMFVRDVADDDAFVIVDHYYDIAGQQVCCPNYIPALEVAAGYDVCLYNNVAGLDSRGGIAGWLEDV